LIAEVAHGAPLSFRDPVTYAFAVGGKDGWPYPVDRNAYDRSVAFLEKGIREAKLGNREKLDALRRLDSWSRAVGYPSVTLSEADESKGLSGVRRDSSTPAKGAVARNDTKDEGAS